MLCHSPYKNCSQPFKMEMTMTDDERCCGTGTCIINAEGYCWCGQRWDGEKMCFPDRQEVLAPIPQASAPEQPPRD
jgi:hypothetical protein